MDDGLAKSGIPAGISGEAGFGKGWKMERTLLNIGFGNTVVADRVVAIVAPNSAPMKRLKDEARKKNCLVDATHGRRTRSIIIMDSNHVVLSAIQAETISQRFEQVKGQE